MEVDPMLRRYTNMISQLSDLGHYGEMTTLQLGSKTWVLLNSNRVASEIIAKHSNITHQRPYMPIASGLVSRDKRTVLRQTASWTEGRRVMHQLLSGHALKTYGHWQEQESVRLLFDYLSEPSKWYSHHYRYTNSVMYRIVFGEGLTYSTTKLDEFQRVTVEFIRSINASPVDFFPTIARLVPSFLQPWRRNWQRMGEDHYRVFRSWWDPVREAVDNGTAPPSFVRDTLASPDTRYTGSDEDAMYLATSIISAGSDNTRMTLNTFVMAMLTHPAAFERARTELDSVCGDAGRLPSLADMCALPYICGVIKEVLRWRPTVPIIPPHELTEDMDFEGYSFPRGTCFVINSIAVCAECDKSDEFKPERWLQDGQQENITHDLWQFGGGRRICVGYKLAQQELFVAVARLIYCFDYVTVGLG